MIAFRAFIKTFDRQIADFGGGRRRVLLRELRVAVDADIGSRKV